MNIKFIKAKCFLSIGITPIEIDFTKLGNIVNIKGNNYDRKEGSSNGSGKTSIILCILYALYGKLLKNMSHKEVINNKIKKGLETEIHFDISGHSYKIIRKRKPDSLQLFRDSVDISQGTMPTTQQEIEKIVGLSYDAFVNITFFGQHNEKSFLSCDAATKRQIVENLLSLDKYNQYCQNAKDKKKELEIEIKQLINNFDNAHNSLSLSEKRFNQISSQQQQWHLNKSQEISLLHKKIELKEKEITSSQNGENFLRFQNAQIEIEKIKIEIIKQISLNSQIQEKIEKIQEKLNLDKKELQELSLQLQECNHTLLNRQNAIKEASKSLKGLTALDGLQKCPVCLSLPSKENYIHVIKHNEEIIEKNKKEEEEISVKKVKIEKSLVDVKGKIEKQSSLLSQCNTKVKQISSSLNDLGHKKMSLEKIEMPVLDLEEKLLKEQKNNLLALVESKRGESDPYYLMLRETQEELESNKEKIKSVKLTIREKEEEMPYVDFWIKGFNEKGIRKLILDDVIEPLNTRINYWLQFLIDNQIKVTFDSNLEVKIESNPPNGDEFVYNGLSGAEISRVNLSISQAFSYITMLNAKTSGYISVAVFDEIVNFQDNQGVHAVYNMICELATNRQLLIITHDQDMLQMLEGQDNILVEKKGGFSTAIINYSK